MPESNIPAPWSKSNTSKHFVTFHKKFTKITKNECDSLACRPFKIRKN